MSKKRMSDIGVKISAVVIALIIWAFVMDDVNPEIDKHIRNIPVSFTNAAALERQGLVIMEPQEVTIDVRVTGSKSDIDRFNESNLSAQVDLSGYSEGQVRVIPTVGITGQASSVRIVDYQPREILFTFDRVITREYPVRVVTTGELDDNYLLGSIDTSTNNIVVEGPRTWMNEVHEVIAYVDIEGRTSTATTNVAVRVVDDEGNEVRGVEKSPNMINLEIPILRTQSVPVELQTVGELPENFTISNLQISPSEVDVVGDHNVLTLTRINTEEINVDTLLENDSLEVDLIIPEGMELLDSEEQTITITYDIEEQASESFTFSLEEMVTNMPDELSISEENLEETVEVTISGESAQLEDIDREDIEILVDLEGLELGSHELDVRIEDIEGVSIEAEPTTITVTLIQI